MGKIERPQAEANTAVPADGSSVDVLYFASVREGVGLSRETIAVPSSVATVREFLTWLRQRGPAYEAALAPELGIRVAVNHTHADDETPIGKAAEIAIFPMMTGG